MSNVAAVMAVEIKKTSVGLKQDPVPANEKKSLRILVAEDGKNAADMLSLFFELEGHRVETAYDGIEAVERSRNYRPHFVLMDIRMPKLDGLQAAACIRSQPGGESIVIVAMSGLDTEEDRRQSAEAGIDEHLAKPVCPSQLRAVLQRYQPRFAARVE